MCPCCLARTNLRKLFPGDAEQLVPVGLDLRLDGHLQLSAFERAALFALALSLSL